MIEVDPQPRIDTLISDGATGQARRQTEYLGTAWFNGRVEIGGPMLRRVGPPGVTTPEIQAAFFPPDSLPYRRDALDGAQLSLELSLRAGGETAAIVAAEAAFVDDPSGAPTWVQVQLHAFGVWPFAVNYRLIALTAPDAVAA